VVSFHLRLVGVMPIEMLHHALRSLYDWLRQRDFLSISQSINQSIDQTID